ncbi:MAG TPA: DUF2721 domain-containing protein [Stellaceae bacterium]
MLNASTDFGTPLDAVAQIIRMALTPVFLLLSLSALLNVFSTRLAVVGDRVEQITKALETADDDHALTLKQQLVRLYRRTLALDTAVILSAIAKTAVCAAVLLLFAGAMGDESVGLALLIAFGVAIVCALGAILAYTAEMLMAGTGIRAELAHGHRRHLLHFSPVQHDDT